MELPLPNFFLGALHYICEICVEQYRFAPVIYLQLRLKPAACELFSWWGRSRWIRGPCAVSSLQHGPASWGMQLEKEINIPSPFKLNPQSWLTPLSLSRLLQTKIQQASSWFHREKKILPSVFLTKYKKETLKSNLIFFQNVGIYVCNAISALTR